MMVLKRGIKRLMSCFELSLMSALENIIKKAINNKNPIKEFFTAVSAVKDFDMNDVYSLYIGKNCLNQFRQDHGYKQGTYQKIWDNQEDNVKMQKILQENKNISYDELYGLLEQEYGNKTISF